MLGWLKVEVVRAMGGGRGSTRGWSEFLIELGNISWIRCLMTIRRIVNGWDG